MGSGRSVHRLPRDAELVELDRELLRRDTAEQFQTDARVVRGEQRDIRRLVVWSDESVARRDVEARSAKLVGDQERVVFLPCRIARRSEHVHRVVPTAIALSELDCLRHTR
ncbi:Uncharacterised protein [Mycobacteroides abscessus subsp. abscessus]|nr:Uncharacterised protein [Mycobacteroides abscessus subsp. abscessus]